MNKMRLFLVVVATSFMFFSCSKDDNKGNAMNETYSSDSKRDKKLELTFSGAPMLGKIANFSTTNGKNGIIKMSNAPISKNSQPASGALSINIPSLKFVNDTYTFKGKTSINYNTNPIASIDCDLYVSKTEMKLSISNLTFNENNVQGKYTLVATDAINGVLPIYINWASTQKVKLGTIEMEPGQLLELVISSVPFKDNKTVCMLLSSVLKSMEFRPDGNFIVEYSEANNIAAPQWQNSPINTIMYLPNNNIAKVFIAEILASSSISSNPLFANIFQQISPDGTVSVVIKQDGNYSIIYLPNELLLPIFKMLGAYIQDPSVREMIINLIPENIKILNYDARVIIGALLEQLPDIINNTTNIELGIRTTKGN